MAVTPKKPQSNPPAASEKPPERTEQLIHRIAELEFEQRSSRDQISQLTTDKARIEGALAKLRQERASMAVEMEAALQARLSKIIDAKGHEQQALREKILQYQAETEKKMVQLRNERDEALALTQHNKVTDEHETMLSSKLVWAITLGLSALLVLLTIFLLM